MPAVRQGVGRGDGEGDGEAMKIEIELPDEIVKDTARIAWESAFKTPDYNSKREGYKLVHEAVAQYLATTEVGLAIREAVIRSYKAQHEGIVRDVVAEELRKLVKKVVREEKNEGTLL